MPTFRDSLLIVGPWTMSLHPDRYLMDACGCFLWMLLMDASCS